MTKQIDNEYKDISENEEYNFIQEHILDLVNFSKELNKKIFQILKKIGKNFYNPKEMILNFGEGGFFNYLYKLLIFNNPLIYVPNIHHLNSQNEK